ncbi:MAG: carbohydrate ABC transporter permease [Chloroflexi bacterium]|nr:carbohydrate ABC transporter permease [Chloroflexota bacterium]
MVSTSLKANRQIFLFPPEWIPNPLIWENYPAIFTFAPFHLYTLNTLIITVATTFGSLLSCSLVAYGFARFEAPGSRILFMLLLSTMMLPSIVTLVPHFIIFTRLNWIDTFLPLIVPSYFASPFFVFLLRQFFLTLPRELEDAVAIDGGGVLATWWHVMLPLSKPALGTVAIFSFLGHWNDFVGPLIYLNSEEKYTISIGLRVFQQQHSVEWALLMAASTLMTLPCIVIFFFAQQHFVKGIALTGIKG